MNLLIEHIIEAAWVVFLVYWAWSARQVKSANRSEGFATRFLKYWLPLIVAALLLRPPHDGGAGLLSARFVPYASWLALLGMLLTWLGVLFACWARVVLGANWSAVVQVKQDHELIERGPYRLVRHPIYTGLLFAFFGTALAIGEWRGLLGVAIVAASFWYKLRLEERWMSEQFGPAYQDYMQRVKALVPWVL